MGKIRFFLLVSLILAAAWTDQIMPHQAPVPALNPQLTAVLASFDATPLNIQPEQRAELDALAEWAANEWLDRGAVDLTFIGTRNSRSSQLAQWWATAAAAHFGLEGIHVHSGGTEATVFHAETVAALRRAGFVIAEEGTGAHPVYRVRWSDEGAGAPGFSKRYTDPANPATGFAAVMTCSDADEGCPVVVGAAARFVLPHARNGTPLDAPAGDDPCRQIGHEMHYLMGRVADWVAAN